VAILNAAAFVHQPLERLELVGGVHRHPHLVFGEADFGICSAGVFSVVRGESPLTALATRNGPGIRINRGPWRLPPVSPTGRGAAAADPKSKGQDGAEIL
jgi:hypothetical protein